MIVAPSLFGLNHQKFALTIRGNKRTMAPELLYCSMKFLSLLWIGSLSHCQVLSLNSAAL